MTQNHKRLPTTPFPGNLPTPPHPAPPTAPVEPAEVLGRHKNTGQKDHKGAR